MECPFCSNEIEEYSENCQYCGASLDDADKEDSEEEEATISDAEYEDY